MWAWQHSPFIKPGKHLQWQCDDYYAMIIHAWKLSIIAYIAEPSVSRCWTSFVSKPCKNPSTSEPQTCTSDRWSSFWQDIEVALLWLRLTIELKRWQDKGGVVRVKYTQHRWNFTEWQSLNAGRKVFFNTFVQRSTSMLEWCRKCKLENRHKMQFRWYDILHHHCTPESLQKFTKHFE